MLCIYTHSLSYFFHFSLMSFFTCSLNNYLFSSYLLCVITLNSVLQQPSLTILVVFFESSVYSERAHWMFFFGIASSNSFFSFCYPFGGSKHFYDGLYCYPCKLSPWKLWTIVPRTKKKTERTDECTLISAIELGKRGKIIKVFRTLKYFERQKICQGWYF